MKKLVLLFVLACIAFTSCHHNRREISVYYNDATGSYSMNAYFDTRKTREIERYMDERLGDLTPMSFERSRINGRIALNDHTLFYLKKYPGHIKITLDRDENSEEGYERVRDMCEGMKEVLGEEER